MSSISIVKHKVPKPDIILSFIALCSEKTGSLKLTLKQHTRELAHVISTQLSTHDSNMPSPHSAAASVPSKTRARSLSTPIACKRKRQPDRSKEEQEEEEEEDEDDEVWCMFA